MKKLLFLFLLFHFVGSSQNQIEGILKIKDSNVKIDSAFNTTDALMYDHNDTALILIKTAIKTSLENNRYKLGNLYNKQGDVFYLGNMLDSALASYSKGKNINEASNDKKSIAESFAGLGLTYEALDNLEQAMTSYIESYKIREKIQDTFGLASILNNIGLVYYQQEDYEKSIENLLKCCYYDSLTKNYSGLGYSYSNIGMTYYMLNQNEKAIKYMKKSLKYRTQEKQINNMGITCNNLGNVYSNVGIYDSANYYYGKALEYKKQVGNELQIAITMENIAQYKSEYLGNHKEAISDLQFSLKTFKKLELLNRIRLNHFLTSEVYERYGNIDSAYFHHKVAAVLKDSLHKINNDEIIARLNTQFETEKREKQIEIQNLKLKEQNSTIEKQNLQQRLTLIIAIAVLLVLVAVIYAFIQKRKDNQLLSKQKEEIEDKNEKLNQTNEEILAISEKLDEQNQKLTHQNEHILSSIQYAKRIQEAILPSDSKVKNIITNSSILYLPKDIVSGDFYWVEKVGNTVFWAVVDCTGHGVPGAFMSILGYNGLNKIVKEKNILEPKNILEELTTHVINSLSQSGESNELKDGMDIAICSLDIKTNILKFSGAYNPLYLLRDGEIEIYKGTRRPIGVFKRKNIPDFEQHEIKLKKEDLLYTFTDGVADQFGGVNNQKFGQKRVREFIVRNHKLPIENQKDSLKLELQSWMKQGNEDQLDDICLAIVEI